jgi:hypothetical protein
MRDAGFSCRRPTFCAFKRNRRATNHRSHLSLVPFEKLFPGKSAILVFRHPAPEQDDLLSHAQRHPGSDPIGKFPLPNGRPFFIALNRANRLEK